MKERPDWDTLVSVQLVVYFGIHQTSTLELMHLRLAGFPVNIMGGALLLKMLMFYYPCYMPAFLSPFWFKQCKFFIKYFSFKT